MRKVEIELNVKLQLQIDEGAKVSEVLDEMDYSFTPDGRADVVDTEILNYEVVDSR